LSVEPELARCVHKSIGRFYFLKLYIQHHI
jgi:hypothetical protein